MKSAALAIALTLVACSGDDASALGGDAGFVDAGADANAHDALAETTTDATDATSDANPDDACKATTTKASCDACCSANHQQGIATLNAAITACACQASECQAQCTATLCANPPMQLDTACNNCVAAKLSADAGASGCYDQVLAKCQMDTDCVSYFQCRGVNGAACSSKP